MDDTEIQKIKWTIGILSVPARRTLRSRLLSQLEPQLESYSDIELIVFEDNRKRELGLKTQALIDIAQGEYISFLDDDDEISEHYIETLYPLLDGSDAVAFTGQVSVEGGPWKNVFYSKDHDWTETDEGYLRPHQHLSPIRTDIVRQVEWRGHIGSDSDWARRMKKAELITSESKTDEVLYFYHATSKYNRSGVWVD